MEIDSYLSEIEDKYMFEFKDKQRESIENILQLNDTVVILPTGYGKSRIYFHLPELFEKLSGEKSTVLVISPLQALMKDQISKLEQLNISATVVALTPGLWRTSLTKGQFHSHIKAVVIDEAHCITQWGGEFRRHYDRLAELRSVVPEKTPFVALTATSTKSMHSEILKKLQMKPNGTKTISKLPERTNITYSLKKSSKSVHELEWLLKDLKTNSVKTKKTVIYCRSILSCADLFEYFVSGIEHNRDILDNRLVAMYHRSTAETNKNHVLNEFPNEDSTIRIVFATVAFGMGVDIPDIERVVHWGAPRGLEQFSQESGRAGRNGKPSQSCIYFSSFDTAKGRCNEGVRNLCQTKECIRLELNRYFVLDNDELLEQGNHVNSTNPLCQCCSNCRLNCTCGCCVDFEFCNIHISPENNFESDPIARQFNDQKLKILKDNFIDFNDYLCEEGLNRQLSFDSKFIDCLVENVSFVFCEDDIISLGLLDHDLATEILELIEEVDMEF
ncbi:recQ [Mytilus edulis]|uniref:DNA 3'-5' helicase n=1 Tax=Mytilus edulis TaxID=6550 RepID=A0A8S3U3X3_MYTED|nr:recQ [Mytilus edulis]